MIQRLFLFLAIGLFLIGSTSGAAQGAAAERRPNIIFILVDDMGYGDVGVFGQNARAKAGKPALKTPTLDRLAAEGVKLTDHYCAAPVCAPSRGSLLQGLHQGHCDIRDNQFDKPLPPRATLGTVLKQAGYHTAAVGKWGLAGHNAPWPGHPLYRGFDEYYGFLRHGDAHDHYAGNRGGIFDGLKEVTSGIKGIYDTDLFTARAKKYIRERVQQHKDQPFFLYLAYTLPHSKMQLPPGPYPAGGGLKGGMQWPVNNTGKPDSYVYPDFRGLNWPPNEKCHASMIRRLDDCIGDVVQLVRDLGIEQNTLIVFSSDNGPHNEGNDPRFFSSAGPFDGIKRDLFEGGSREPTIACWQGHFPAGTTSNEISAHYDWMATLAEAAGLPAPAGTDGISLLPTLTGHPDQQRHHSFLYFEYEGQMTGKITKSILERKGYSKRGQMQAIRIGDYVGVRYQMKSAQDHLRLYKVTNDPHEDRDLSKDPQHRDMLARMHTLLITSRTVDRDASRPYDKELFTAVAAPKSVGHLNYQMYEGRWPWVPDFRSMKPTGSGQVKGFVLPDAKADSFGVQWEGFINVPADGNYVFTITSDGGAVLNVHDSLVIDDNYARKSATISGSVLLRAGWHPVRLAYRHDPAKGKAELKVNIAGPAGAGKVTLGCGQ